MNSIKQSAEKLGVSERTVRNLVTAGRLVHHRIGMGRGAIRISDEALDDYLARTKQDRFELAPETKRSAKALKHIKL